jgi:ketosteroid isomerase-like protein
VSEANVALARRGYEAVARGDLEPIRELLAPKVKWHGGDPSAPGACQNRQQALRFMSRAIDHREVGELVDVIDAGDRVVVILRPPTAEGMRPALRANVTTFRDGKVVEMIAFQSPEAALEAVGLGPGRSREH